MDSQNDSGYLTRSTKKGKGDSFVQHPRMAQEEQSRQFKRIAEVEIEELKQSLRYVEIQLAQCREDKDAQFQNLDKSQQELEKAHQNLSKQIRVNQQQAKQINDLQQKIESFTNSQKELMNKGKFKANSYMNEISQRETELAGMRGQVMNMQEELKTLTFSREQLRQQKEILSDQVNDRDQELNKLRAKLDEQNKLIQTLCSASKKLSASGQTQNQEVALEKAKNDFEKAERLARTTNKSTFMNLGDKQLGLVSEERPSSKKRYPVEDPIRATSDDFYISDDSIPSEMFMLIQKYREIIINSRGGQQASLIIDDFFGEAHRLIKDKHMREIAMIRNEQSVEIIKLRKNLEAKLSSPSKASRLRSKENYKAFSANDKFIENEVERQRRSLIEENELLKKRLRASDTIANSSNHDRAKFMEGASWIIKKAHFETEKHIHNLQGILGEFQHKFKDCIMDARIAELNGKQVLKVNNWLSEAVGQEVLEVGEKFESMYENVNFHSKEASQEFSKHRR